MISDKPIVHLLAQFLEQIGVRKVVISPGSRNAPLIITLTNWGCFDCYSIIDERSAAYYALGMSKQMNEPVAIVCTSGTALLNLAPALSEAYYQEIPLIAITADRPGEWIDHEDGQTIRQINIFENYIKNSFSLPDETSEKAFEKSLEILSKAEKAIIHKPLGPIHINIPLEEPLYETTDKSSIKLPVLSFSIPEEANPSFSMIGNIWNASGKVMIVAGVLQPNVEVNELINKISDELNVPVLAAATSNLSGKCIFNTPDTLLASIEEFKLELFKPEVLITIGGPVVSKRLKQFIRTHKPNFQIDIDSNPLQVDTYRSLTHKITSELLPVLQYISNTCSGKPADYLAKWYDAQTKLLEKSQLYLSDLVWSDLWIYNHLLNADFLVGNLHLANSTPVRYGEMFNKNKKLNYYCNRGTSGIDGCVSTAAGAALVSNNDTYIIIGDVGFIYDSNALFNNHLPEQLKVILINNGGGNIFELLPGPPKTNALDYFRTPHNTNIEKICQAFHVAYFKADSIETFTQAWSKFVASEQCSVLELKTMHADNASIFKQYFTFLRNA